VNRAEPMPALAALLREHRDAVTQRWIADILATYPAEAATAFGREQDRFANPVGYSVRAGAQSIVAALCDGMAPVALRAGLHEILRVRAVQQFSPAQALGFVFRLKDAILAELAGADGAPPAAVVPAALDDVIESLALMAFEVYTECREQVYRLRLEETKRRVSWVVDRLNRRSEETAPL
jgi:hypothetical protein